MSQDPATGRWSIMPWDLDHTYGNSCCSVNSNFVTPAEPGDKTRAISWSPSSRSPSGARCTSGASRPWWARSSPQDDSRPSTTRKVGPAQPEATLDFASLAPRWKQDVRESAHSPVQRHRRPQDGLRQRRRVPAAAERCAAHRHQRDPALADGGERCRVRGALQPLADGGGGPLRLVDLRRDRPPDPAGSRDPASVARWCSSPMTRRSGARTGPHVRRGRLRR